MLLWVCNDKEELGRLELLWKAETSQLGYLILNADVNSMMMWGFIIQRVQLFIFNYSGWYGNMSFIDHYYVLVSYLTELELFGYYYF